MNSFSKPYNVFNEQYNMFVSGCGYRMCSNFKRHSRLSDVMCISWPQHWNWRHSW